MNLYTFLIDLNWNIINKLSHIDRFAGEWSRIILTDAQALKHLQAVATVRSVGASTRIEGSKMTDDEVEVLINNLKIEKLEEPDQQEVAGYFEALDLVSEAHQDIAISESAIQSLHIVMMKYCVKDEWHKGKYKQESNSLEATRADGSKYVVFKTTSPGWVTEDAMRKLVAWYNDNREVHPLVRAAVFVYEFLSIHPFQNGNGRLSRLLTTLLLLKEGYGWIEYVSSERDIERRKNEYYKVLMECQRNRPAENITSWILFFIDCLANIQQQLVQKLETRIEDVSTSPRVQQIRMYVEHHGGARTGEIADSLGIPLPTVKKEVAAMVISGLLIKHGNGAGTNYTASPRLITRPDLMLKLGKNEPVNTFKLNSAGACRMIKKIILVPLFEWVQPDDWLDRLLSQALYLQVVCTNRNGNSNTNQFVLSNFSHPYLFKPVFTFKDPLVIPDAIMHRTIYQYEYPWEVTISLKGSVAVEDYVFDVLVVYDEKE